MNFKVRMFIVAMLAAMSMPVMAQKAVDPTSYVTYSLPSTTIMMDVEAVQESFHAGPYAKYADKYLGIKVGQKDETTCQITSISIRPVLEVDLSRRYVLEVRRDAPDVSFLKLTSAGLVAFPDGNFGQEQTWRFPISSDADFSSMGVSSNLKSEATTLYRNEKNNRVAVQQNMVVEKTLEQKAAEAAQMIIRLREQRLQIVTGDTDATYSGEAMGAAIDELTRLEEEYMSMFIGYSDVRTQQMTFEVVPDATRESQMYVAFRISDTSGLVPSDNLSGKPVVMEIVPQGIAVPEVEPQKEKSKGKESKVQNVNYMIPVVCTVKITDGSNLLIQSRMPIYQLGILSTMPVNATLQ